MMRRIKEPLDAQGIELWFLDSPSHIVVTELHNSYTTLLFFRIVTPCSLVECYQGVRDRIKLLSLKFPD
jgi:hypothetical protein